MPKKNKIKMILAGILNWEEFRNDLTKHLKSCKSEEDFLRLMNSLYYSMSNSEEEMQKKRRSLGIPET